MFIVTARNNIVGFFVTQGAAWQEYMHQTSLGSHPKLYNKEQAEDATTRRRRQGRYRGAPLAGAHVVDMNKPSHPPHVRLSSKVRSYSWSEMHKVARQYAAADRGDPFCYDRAMSLMTSGVAKPKDYDKGGRP